MHKKLFFIIKNEFLFRLKKIQFENLINFFSFQYKRKSIEKCLKIHYFRVSFAPETLSLYTLFMYESI